MSSELARGAIPRLLLKGLHSFLYCCLFACLFSVVVESAEALSPPIIECDSSKDCPDDTFCSFEEGACASTKEQLGDAPAASAATDSHAVEVRGACWPIPQICTREYRPVCGCDSKTYPNECVAHSKGQSIAAKGACNEKAK